MRQNGLFSKSTNMGSKMIPFDKIRPLHLNWFKSVKIEYYSKDAKCWELYSLQEFDKKEFSILQLRLNMRQWYNELYFLDPIQVKGFLTIFSEMVDFCMGPLLNPYLTPYDQEKKTFHKIIFPCFSCRFRKKKPFCRKMVIWGFFSKRLLSI